MTKRISRLLVITYLLLGAADLSAQREVWNANDLQRYLKRACEVSWQVEEAITDSNGNVQRDQNGQVRTRMVTKSKTNYSCVPGKFDQLRVRQNVKFLKVSEGTFGADYVVFGAGSVDLKCIASKRDIQQFKRFDKGTRFDVEGTVVRWEWGLIDDDLIMNCIL